MSQKKQITVTLPNKVGELVKLTQCLAKSKVNIEAISVSNLLDVGVVRFVPSNATAAKKALSGLGVAVSIDDVLVVALPNDVGALTKAAAKLKRKKVNIEYVYGSVAGGSAKAQCVFKTSDLKATAAILA